MTGGFMKTLFFAILLITQTVWGAGLPKKALLVLQLDQPAVTVQFPNLDFSTAKISPSGVAEFSNPGNIIVGSVTYKMGPKALLYRKDETKEFTIENLRMISYPFYSTEVNTLVGHFVVNQDGTVYLYKKGAKGTVTEWY
jgi:hypothetical protein